MRVVSAARARIARLLPDLHFPPSLHGELREAVGLELEPAEIERPSPARPKPDLVMQLLREGDTPVIKWLLSGQTCLT
ncbi:hypothetical protein SAMN05216268_11295 [Streptomyces yunnanensis]|uniref:Uncharacterized protein n=1 Tax=Streptomyces yunnanensis TaxID=156453 RepID=A0A9X8N0Y5_9ACTN|nr:hypothetical protein SAMN05216268_11295 [Streptomyces yunnanensis]